MSLRTTLVRLLGVFNFAILAAIGVSFSAIAAPTLWVDDSGGVLGKVDVGTGTVSIVGNMGTVLTDIAFAPNGDLYGISFTTLYRINTSTAALTSIGSTGIPNGNALVFSSNGTLYAASNANTNLYRINPATGSSTSLGSMSFTSAGDLAFVNGVLYMSSTGSNLIRISLSPSVSGTAIGPFGFGNVFGLATPDSQVLYGLSGSQIFATNISTGAGTAVLNYGGHGLSSANGSTFFSEATLPGDYNASGKVDAADYVVWRNKNGASEVLPNDNELGAPVRSAHYSLWRQNFGKQISGSAFKPGSVPEPSTIAFLLVTVFSAAFRRSSWGCDGLPCPNPLSRYG